MPNENQTPLHPGIPEDHAMSDGLSRATRAILDQVGQPSIIEFTRPRNPLAAGLRRCAGALVGLTTVVVLTGCAPSNEVNAQPTPAGETATQKPDVETASPTPSPSASERATNSSPELVPVPASVTELINTAVRANNSKIREKVTAKNVLANYQFGAAKERKGLTTAQLAERVAQIKAEYAAASAALDRPTLPANISKLSDNKYETTVPYSEYKAAIHTFFNESNFAGKNVTVYTDWNAAKLSIPGAGDYLTGFIKDSIKPLKTATPHTRQKIVETIKTIAANDRAMFADETIIFFGEITQPNADQPIQAQTSHFLNAEGKTVALIEIDTAAIPHDTVGDTNHEFSPTIGHGGFGLVFDGLPDINKALEALHPKGFTFSEEQFIEFSTRDVTSQGYTVLEKFAKKGTAVTVYLEGVNPVDGSKDDAAGIYSAMTSGDLGAMFAKQHENVDPSYVMAKFALILTETEVLSPEQARYVRAQYEASRLRGSLEKQLDALRQKNGGKENDPTMIALYELVEELWPLSTRAAVG